MSASFGGDSSRNISIFDTEQPESIDVFWRKLNFSPAYIDESDHIDYNVEVDKFAMKEEDEIWNSVVQDQTPPSRHGVQSMKEHTKVEARSSESTHGMKKPPKHVKHAFENGEFVKRRSKDEHEDTEKMGDKKWCWYDYNKNSKDKMGTSHAGGSRRRGRSPTPPGSPGADKDIADILDTRPFLQFPHRTDAYRRLERLITRPIERLGVFDADVEASMTARYRPERVGRATLSAMGIAADFRGLGFRFSLQRGVPWVPQQQHVEVHAPAGAPLQPPPPPRGRRLVFRDPVLWDQSRRLDRLEDLAAWQSDILIAVATHLGVQIPPLSPPRHFDPQTSSTDKPRSRKVLPKDRLCMARTRIEVHMSL
ncbi:hypothetical protein E3N88_05151 [Mikania micrantha]|uniref:Uncharacterized protein n=1 Tax=Mikania micrantha TaxID=192012 RepID=A0A5N6PXD5_9ASTR|nr:hypothetical protein E3N88_05151 [Mikania micrantha]